MIETEAQLKSLLEHAEQVERSARRRALLLTLVPILFAALLLAFTFWQVLQASQELNQKNQVLASRNQEIAQATSTLAGTRKDLATAQSNLNQQNIMLNTTGQRLTETVKDLKIAQADLDKQTKLLATQTVALGGFQKQVVNLQTQVADLKIANALEEYKFPYEWDVTLKEMYRLYGTAAYDVIMLVDDNLRQHIPWNPNGMSPKEGFNSPSFAAYILTKAGLLPADSGPIINQFQLMQAMQKRNGDPQPGDVVFYQGGFSLFYYLDERGNPFMIGMTPRGIMALNYKFAPIIGFGAAVSR